MSFWDKNIEAVKEKDKELSEKLEKLYGESNQDNWDFMVEQARDYSDILGVFREGRKIMLNSTYRPAEEAVKYAGKIQLTENSVTVFFGGGNGKIVTEILKKLNKEAMLLIYEPSVELFLFVMEHFDIADIIQDERTGLFVEGINDDVFGNNLTFLLSNINVGVTVMEAHPKYQELFPEQYNKAAKIFKDCRETALVNLNTIINRSRLMTENAIANIPHFLYSKLSADYVGKFPDDMPAIIVAGGPSLDKNYEVLRQAKGKALIIALDRTAKFLLDRGIEPDLFCSLDYNKNPRLFEDERLKNIPFLYIPDLSNRVMNMVSGNKMIYGTGDYRIYEWMIRQYGKTPMQLPIGGSVATFAFGFARYMNINRVILVGQDLALTGGKTYAGGWTNGRAEAEEFEHLMVPGNVEEMVETRGDFYTYLVWFNQAVKEAEGQMEVINATEGGARIEGTRVTTLQEAVDTYCTREYDVAGIFDAEEPIFPQDRLPEVYLLLENKLREIKKLKDKAKAASEAARRCKILTERGDTTKEFKKNNKILSQTGKLFDEDVAASLVNKYVENVLLQKDMDLYVTEDDNQKEMMRLYDKLTYDYKVVYENIDGLVESFHTMLIGLKEELGIDE